MDLKPSSQPEDPLAGLFVEAAGEGFDAGVHTVPTDSASLEGGAEPSMQAHWNEIVKLITRAQALFPAESLAGDARTAVNTLTNSGVRDFAMIIAQLVRKCDRLQLLSVGAVGVRSSRSAGPDGVAQASGFKSSVEMIQHLTGSSWGEAARKVRVGESMLADETAERAAREQREALAARLAQEEEAARLALEAAKAARAGGGDAGEAGVGDEGVGEAEDLGDLTALEVATAEVQSAEAELVLAVPWSTVLNRAVSRDLLTATQSDAIRQGLGEPPRATAADVTSSKASRSVAVNAQAGAVCATTPTAQACAFHTAAYAALQTSGCRSNSASPTTGLTTGVDETLEACDGRCEAAFLALWWQAGVDLIDAARHTRVEELRAQARAIRDLLDPDGATVRRNQRYEARSFKWWTDAKGQFHGHLTCDDDAGAWISTIFASALRPRRGGPRFIDPEEQAAGEELAQDPRTHQQISHDLLIDLLQSGAVADQKTVFGTRQVGVRVVQVVNRADYLAEQAEARAAEAAAKKGQAQQHANDKARAEDPTNQADPVGVVAWYEDGLTVISDAAVARQRCNAGVVHVTVDENFNPLDVGREQRLYNGAQRIALATRDGGCRWPGCDRPSSYCEAHHIDEWHSDQGRTDIDRGILLCRAHHMQLHNHGWKISRDRRGPFMLHPPPEAEGAAVPIPMSQLATPPAREPALREVSQLSVGSPQREVAPQREPSPQSEFLQPRELAPPLSIAYGLKLAASTAKRFKPADQRAYVTANGYA